MENDREFTGKKILSISNCTSVKLMDGSLESVGGLEEVELTKVRRIELESGAFSGQQLKHISGEILHFEKVANLNIPIMKFRIFKQYHPVILPA